MEDLDQIIARQNGDTPPAPQSSVTDPVNPPVFEPAAGSPSDQISVSPPAGEGDATVASTTPTAPLSPASSGETSPQFNFMQEMESRGVDVSGFSDDREAFEAFSSAMGQIAEVANSPEYQEYLDQRAGGQLNQPAAAAAPVEQPQESVTPDPVATKRPSIMDLPEISDTADMLRRNNVITKDSNGFWASQDPRLDSYVKELNDYDLAFQTRGRAMLSDPGQFIEPIVESALEARVTAAVEARLKDMGLSQEVIDRVSQLEQHQVQVQVDQDRARISEFVKSPDVMTEDGNLTEYGQKLRAIDEDIIRTNPELSEGQRLDEVLRRASRYGFEPTAAPEKAEQGKPAPKKTFVAAGSKANGSVPQNRLKDFTGEMPAKEPESLTDAQGFPSLEAAIAETSQTIT